MPEIVLRQGSCCFRVGFGSGREEVEKASRGKDLYEEKKEACDSTRWGGRIDGS